MNFEYEQGQKIIQKAALDFAKAELEPIAFEDDRNPRYPKEIIEKIAKNGFLGLTVPKEYGGTESDLLSAVCVVDSFGRYNASVASIVATHLVVSKIISKYADADVKDMYLSDLVSGRVIGGYAFAEPGASPGCGDDRVIAKREGSDYILSGKKTYVTNGGEAGVYLVTAVLEEDDDRREQALFAVDAELTENLGLIDKLGLRSFPTADVDFPSVKGLRIDGGIQGKALLEEVQILSDIFSAGLVAGIGKTLVSETAEYANTRIQFGSPIGRMQAVQWMLSEMAAHVHYIDLGKDKAAVSYDEGSQYVVDTAFLKLYATNAAQEIGMNGVQIHGGTGFSREAKIERYFRDIRGAFHSDSINDYPQKVIAKWLLK